jgi:ketosteroid isomerase-like protein
VEDLVDAGDDRVVAVVRQGGRLRGADSWVELRFGTVYIVDGGQIRRGQVFMTAQEALEAVGLSE